MPIGVTLGDRELEPIQIRLAAALSRWPPTPAALRELVALARQDLPVVLAALRERRRDDAEERDPLEAHAS